jgi:primary-amine oxidase
MPVEPMTLLLRPRHFFRNNPVMDVPPSYSSTPSMMVAGKGNGQGNGVVDATDRLSRLAFENGSGACCKN